MFILSARLTKKRLCLIVLGAGVLLCLIIMLVSVYRVNNSYAGYSKVETAEDRLVFIRSFGWQIKEEPVQVEEVLIPESFDGVYEEYNDIQKEQGLDLTKNAGRLCTKYTYEITNYPTGEKGVLINLLVYKGTVIGGDVMSPKLDGFMHGFNMPAR